MSQTDHRPLPSCRMPALLAQRAAEYGRSRWARALSLRSAVSARRPAFPSGRFAQACSRGEFSWSAPAVAPLCGPRLRECSSRARSWRRCLFLSQRRDRCCQRLAQNGRWPCNEWVGREFRAWAWRRLRERHRRPSRLPEYLQRWRFWTCDSWGWGAPMRLSRARAMGKRYRLQQSRGRPLHTPIIAMRWKPTTEARTRPLNLARRSDISMA